MIVPHDKHSFSDDELITAKDLAVELGVSKPSITKAKNAGRITVYINSERRERFHLPTARREWYANRSPGKALTERMLAKQGEAAGDDAELESILGIDPSEADFEFNFERAKREHYAAEITRLKTDELKGSLVPKLEASQRVYELASSVKDRLLSVHIKVASSVMPPLEAALADQGLDPQSVRNALSVGKIELVVGEIVRKGVIDSLRDIVAKERDGFV